MECGCHARDASSNYTNKDGYGDDNDCGDDEGDNDYGDDNGDHGDGDKMVMIMLVSGTG